MYDQRGNAAKLLAAAIVERGQIRAAEQQDASAPFHASRRAALAQVCHEVAARHGLRLLMQGYVYGRGRETVRALALDELQDLLGRLQQHGAHVARPSLTPVL